MSLPTGRAAYLDYYRIWDAAVADGSGIRLRCESFSTAHYHRARLHMSRAIAKDESREIHAPGDPGWNRTPYDHYMVTVRRVAGEDVDGAFYLIIAPRTLGIIGPIETLKGTEHEPIWSTNLALEHEPLPQLTSPTGTKLLGKRSDFDSESPNEPSSSQPSTTPDEKPPTLISRRS